MPVPADLVAFALQLAEVARGETLPRFHAGTRAEDKGAPGAYDPVTEADRAAERAIRARIAAMHPDHGIWGEEYGLSQGSSAWSWSLDPIDGTRAFICGLPTWTTLIALLHDGAPVLGIVDAPRLDELYYGHGSEAWLIHAGERRSISTSGCARVAEARISNTDPFLFSGEQGELHRIRERARLARWGLDAYAYARLAAGGLDLVAETSLKPHDWQALVPVVRGAGGVMTDWQGRDGLESGTVLACATAELSAEAVFLLGPSPLAGEGLR